ncbi:MAG: FHA domain-containing serine/threonine-protein kinase [Terriglobales bacterium]
MKVALTVIKGPQIGRVLEFNEPRGYVVGRALHANFQLPEDDLYVARRHIYLEICPPTCRVCDLGTKGSGSTNPPHINDHPLVAEAELKDGDVLELGYTQFKVSIDLELTPKTKKCLGCGVRMEFLPGEREPEQCNVCAALAQGSRKPAAPVIVGCLYCGSDLRTRANSDGRAGEMLGSVVYCCERCLPKRDQFGGLVIGGYEVVRRLGEGGMGAVSLVYQRATCRLFAMKQMKDLREPLLIKRFEREMRLMKALTHDNIVRCLETGIDSHGSPFVVTEFVSGGDLEQLVCSNGKLPSSNAVGIILKVLDGVEYLHQRGIIHRDIKPQNILIGKRPLQAEDAGESIIPKITDFGLAVSYGRAGGTRLTKAGSAMGTLIYMPPEQIIDAGNVREPADLYSVGAVLYHLLTGSYVFDFPTPQEIMELQRQRADVKNREEALRKIMQLNRIRHPFNIVLAEEPTPIRKRDTSIPEKLAVVLDKAVRKDPQRRFQSAAEFRNALEDAHRYGRLNQD